MAEQNMRRMTQFRPRYGISQADLANATGISGQLISLIELDTASQGKGHEALIRRAFSAVVISRRATLNGLAHELDAASWLLSMSKEDDEHGF